MTLSRRSFLKTTSAASALCWIAPADLLAAHRSANEKLNVAVIGAGGRGGANLRAVSGENVVAICDVDLDRAAGGIKAHPQAKVYRDFRKLIDAEHQQLDAVVVSTPDHCHAPASVTAMRAGLHVYCEKPLTHSVAEARVMREIANENKLVTQMGTQGHSMDGARQSVEMLRAGVIGDVREVHAWTDRPGRWWPQAVDRPSEAMAVPANLDWDLWLGPAPERPYHSAYAPFAWRGWWDFGTGALGDMGCHVLDMVFWALRLENPTTIHADASDQHAETGPASSVITWQFAARGPLGPTTLRWYDGARKPSAELAGGAELPANGILVIGSEGIMLALDPYGAEVKLLPEDKFVDYEPPAPTLPRSPGHHQEWIQACKGEADGATLSDFDYASRLTETVLLGNVALRAGGSIEWDAGEMRVTNNAAANALLGRPYRAGWTL